MSGKFSDFDKGRLIGMLESGIKQKIVCEKFNLPKSTVSRWWKEFKEFGSLKQKKGSGRTKKHDIRTEKALVRNVLRSKSGAVSKVAKYMRDTGSLLVSNPTAKRMMHNQKFVARKKTFKPFLTDKHMQKRKLYGHDKLLWTEDDWKKVLFTDETKVNLFGSDGMQWYWSKPEETLNKQLTRRAIKPTKKHGGGSVHIWGCFGFKGVGFCCRYDGGMNAELYLQILGGEMLDSIPHCIPVEHQDDWFLMHDNAPCHRARIVENWLEQNGIRTLDHPAQSPDLNPIENLWSICKQKLYGRKKGYNSKEEAFDAFTDIFNNEIKETTCQKLVKSLVKIISAVWKSNGLSTKY